MPRPPSAALAPAWLAPVWLAPVWLAPVPLATVSLVMATLALCGCAVGPDFHTPAAPTLSRYTPEPLPAATGGAATRGGADQAFVQGQDVAGPWWTLFGSPALNDLVARALKANPDLAAAREALRGARETYLAQRGALLL